CVIVHAHRTAHRHDGIERVAWRERLTFVQLHAQDLGMSLAQHVLVFPGWFAGDVLEHQDAHHPSKPSSGRTPVTVVRTSPSASARDAPKAMRRPAATPARNV